VDKVGQVLESFLLAFIPQTGAVRADAAIGLDTSRFDHGKRGTFEHIVANRRNIERCKDSLLGAGGGS
jgi:hypothetical protein